MADAARVQLRGDGAFDGGGLVEELSAAECWADAEVRAEPGGAAGAARVQLRGGGAVAGGGSVEELPGAERWADVKVRAEPGGASNAACVQLRGGGTVDGGGSVGAAGCRAVGRRCGPRRAWRDGRWGTRPGARRRRGRRRRLG